MKKYFFIFIVFLSLSNYASHIVGGEMIYDYLGNNKYRITLKVYRDCSSSTTLDGAGPNTSPAIITIIAVNSGVSYTMDIGAPVLTNIPPTINNPCIQTPQNICVQEGVYTGTLTLPPVSGGHYIVYQRCCRNNSIVNLLISGQQGSTYFTKIPGPEDAINNSSPRFSKFPPIFLCNSLDFTFDHSAVDPDGDVLVYSLCPPFQGGDQCCPVITGAPGASSPGCPSPPFDCPNVAPAPPYAMVNFVSPYTGSYPIASNPSVTIDPTTGLLKGFPNLTGQYVVGVCVEEYRNNVLIATHFRDFQFNIVSCVVSIISSVADQLKQCQGKTISFVNASQSNVGSLTYFWDFGDPNSTTDTSHLVDPTYTYQDTGTYYLTLIANPNKPCSDTMKKIVYVYPPLDIDFIPPLKQCLKGNSFSFDVRGSYIPQTNFFWNFTSSATPSNSVLKSPANVSFNQPGTYVVKLYASHYSCRDTTIDSVTIIKRPVAKINNPPSRLCDPGRITFSNASTSELPLRYLWRFSNGQSSTEFEPSQVFSPSGVYSATLIAITQSLCTDSNMTSVNTITVNRSPVAEFLLSPDVTSIFEPEITVQSKTSFDAISWKYYFGDGAISVFPEEKHIYAEAGDYVITQVVTNSLNCTDTARHLVQIIPEFRFWVPNAFTPDGSSLNDIFQPILIGVTDYDFEIFDRWGQRIFRTNDLAKGWDGSFKGKVCKDDIYIWRISFFNTVSSKNEIRCGHVSIMKNL